ncbi:MAG: hypothetical protein Q8O43_06095 [Dehalococcoidia bacterium]|nr:hypothetical protein [Dehalococcoidia bacterium]
MSNNFGMSKQRGSAFEELTDQFCERSFLQDFLFLRPKRVSVNRELTDLMAILDDKCLCIQIKARGNDSPPSGLRLISWATKQFIKAGRQAEGAIRKVKTSEISAVHPWRGSVVFHLGDLVPVCGIVLVEYMGPPFALTLEVKPENSGGIPIHYFSLNDFLNLVDLLGTLPDIIEYLQQRAEISHDVKSIIGNERDLYATYLLDGHLRSDLSYKEIKNRWAHLIDVEESFERKRKHNIFVDFYNGLISELRHQDPDKLSYQPPELANHVMPLSDRTSYLEIATRLNKLPYTYRREIGKHLFQTTKAVKSDGKTRMFTYRGLGQPWVLTFLVTPNMDRTLRIRQLHLLVASNQIRYGCQSVIGIACPSLDSNQGFDYVFVDKVTYSEEEVKKLAPTITKTSEITVSPFPKPIDDSLLPKDEDFE